MFDRPIPQEAAKPWKNIPITECGEILVPLGLCTDFSDCDTSAIYFGERESDMLMNFLGHPVNRQISLITHFVRSGVLQRLKAAQQFLPQGHYFKFLDTYRPLAVQTELFEGYKTQLIKEHPEWNEQKLETETERYVAQPSPNYEKGTVHPSPHSTGGVMDLTIVRLTKEGISQLEELEKLDHRDKNKYFLTKADIFKHHSLPLNMGTEFDEFSTQAETAYYETRADLPGGDLTARDNRRLLYYALAQVGFVNYYEEWWHWGYGDQVWAASSGQPAAIYDGINLSEENKAFERLRREIYEKK